MALSAKKAQFVREYLVDLNATQAAIRAGFSEKTAYSQGQRLLKDVEVAAAVELAQAKRAERTEITQDQVLRELAAVGFARLSDVTDWGTKEVAFGYDEDGKKLRAEQIGDAVMVQYVDAPFVTPLNRDELPDAVRAAVAEVSLGKEGFKIKMHDKVGALEKIGRHLGMFKERVEHSGPGGGPIETTNVSDRDLAKALAFVFAKAEAQGGN
jgi:phage terminase small subunit